MAQPLWSSSQGLLGVDPTVIYVSTAQSINPELSPQQFILGQEMIGNNASQWVFVQASTSITGSDFVAITGVFQANSLTNTNVALGPRLGIAPSVTTGILAGQFFWAAMNGSNLTGNTVSASAINVQLFTSATAGQVTSVSATIAAALGGVVVMTSGTSTTAQFQLSWPRVVNVISTSAGQISIPGDNNP